MGNVVDTDKNEPHLTGELICIKCGYRALNTWNVKTWLAQLVCPNCQAQGFMIATGQIMPEPEEKPSGPYAKQKESIEHKDNIIYFNEEVRNDNNL